ncbi:MAG: maleylacetate reductase [Bacteroidota bacterium]
MDFRYSSSKVNIVFGRAAYLKAAEVLAAHDRVFVIATERSAKQLQSLQKLLPQQQFESFQEIVQHVPQSVVDRCAERLSQFGGQVLLAIGGGSAIGLAKALALQTALPIVAIPTTYSGSEMTNIWGISRAGQKSTGRDPKVQASHVYYDPDLSQTMPPAIAATSAMNAMAHLMEAVYAHDRNPITHELSLLGIRKLLTGMNALAEAGKLSAKANEALLFGAYLAGKALGEVSMALHHKAAHVLGGSFGLEHAKVHTILQAYVLEYQWGGLSEEIQAAFVDAFGDESPPKVLKKIAQKMGTPTNLHSIGFDKKDIPAAVEIMLQKPYPNPVPLERSRLEAMLRRAYKGN